MEEKRSTNNTSAQSASISKTTLSLVAVFTILVSGFVGLGGGLLGYEIASQEDSAEDSVREIIDRDIEVITEESAVISVAEQASDSVVSIVISQDVPIFEQQQFNSFEDFFFRQNTPREQIGTEEQQIGSGTGFVVSEEGLLITNRHVVTEEDAKYTVFFNDGSSYEASVIARDSVLDIAFMQIDENITDGFPHLELGASDNLRVGQSVIAIGNALGEFSNTVSSGIVSGLNRDIVASGQFGGSSEQLFDVIQTDASINFGNSGGPLLDVSGKVIGVNVAVARNAENIGFAIPIDEVVRLLDRLEETNSLDRPLLGVRFTIITEESKEILAEIGYEVDDEVNSGAIIRRGENSTQVAVQEGSPADIAGLQDGDIILSVDGTEINVDNPLNVVIQNKFPGDVISLEVLRGNEIIEFEVEL